MKRLASSPSTIPVLAVSAALLALAVGFLTSPPAPPQDPLDVLRSPTLSPSFDAAFWSRLAAEDPGLLERGAAYCASRSDRPNCQAVRTAWLLTVLNRDAARTRGDSAPLPAATPRTPLAPEP